MKLCGIQLKMSTSKHPQTDGSSEIMNRMVENYLRCYCNFHQDNWDELLPSAEFAYNSAITEDLGLSPFEIDLGWKPKSPLEILTSEKSNNESVEEFKFYLKETLEDAKFSYMVAKAEQNARSSLRYKPHVYKPGDKLWINKTLFKDSYSKAQNSDKLSSKRFGPFTVKSIVGRNAVKLNLPDNVKIHDVVSIMHTVPYKEQPVEIANPSPQPPDPIPVDAEEEYEVDEILSHRKRGQGFQFLTS